MDCYGPDYAATYVRKTDTDYKEWKVYIFDMPGRTTRWDKLPGKYLIHDVLNTNVLANDALSDSVAEAGGSFNKTCKQIKFTGTILEASCEVCYRVSDP